MTSHLVLVPIAYNDGSPVPNEVFDRLMLELTVLFGGWFVLPPSFGGWEDKEGKYQPEKHRPVTVHVPDERREDFLTWVRKTGKELGQEVMLVMFSFCEVSFIEIDSRLE